MVYCVNPNDLADDPKAAIPDYTSLTVTRNMNGAFVLSMTIPSYWEYTSNPLSNIDVMVAPGKIILAPASPYPEDNLQQFVIKSIKHDDKTMTSQIIADHVSSRINHTFVNSFSSETESEFLNYINNNYEGMGPLHLTSDRNRSIKYTQKKHTPRNVRDLLFSKSEPSYVTLFGGEAEIDNLNISFHERIGNYLNDRVVYGRNLGDFKYIKNEMSYFDKYYPYYNSGDTYVELPEKTLNNSDSMYLGIYGKVVTVDLTDKFESAPSVSELREAAKEWFNEHQPTSLNEEVSFSILGDFPSVHLGDIFEIVNSPIREYPDYRIIQTVYDGVQNRYTKLISGVMAPDLSETLIDMSNK